MNLFILSIFIAATATDPATTDTNSTNSNNSSKNSTTTKKNSKNTATVVADSNTDSAVALPKTKKTKATEEVPAMNDNSDPASLVSNSIDAATQIANDAAKAALEEAAKLAAIGSDGDKSSAAGSVINAQTISAVSDGAVAVAKEIKKPKAKKSAEDNNSSEEAVPKPAKKSKASSSDNSDTPADSPKTKN
jgi:hypothetical protein